MSEQGPRPTPRARHQAPAAAPPTPPVVPTATPQQAGENDYTGTVTAPMQIVIGVGSGILLAVILVALSSGLWPAAIVVFLVATATGVYLAPLSLMVADGRITIGQGRREREPLVLYVAEVRDAGLREMTFAQCLGFAGVESDDRTTRLAVRPGTTLVLTLHSGERYLVSVADGPAALRAIAATPAR